jgi:hypothetical protein
MDELLSECLCLRLPPHPCVINGQVQPAGIQLIGGGGACFAKKLQEITEALLDRGHIQECF